MARKGGSSSTEIVKEEVVENASSEGSEEVDQIGGGKSYGKRRGIHRQSFSLDEGALLGYSTVKESWGDEPKDSRQAEILFLSSKKREECLKVYDKMTKTGLNVKLDTIFRGMLTPSEYRIFIKATEDAAKEAAAKAKADEEAASEQDVGVSAERDDTQTDAGVTDTLAFNLVQN